MTVDSDSNYKDGVYLHMNQSHHTFCNWQVLVAMNIPDLIIIKISCHISLLLDMSLGVFLLPKDE